MPRGTADDSFDDCELAPDVILGTHTFEEILFTIELTPRAAGLSLDENSGNRSVNQISGHVLPFAQNEGAESTMRVVAVVL